MRTFAWLLPGLLLAFPALAQDAEEIVVVGIVPLGSGVEAGKIPYPVQTADAGEIADAAAVSLADFLRSNFGSVSLNDAQNNPLQPDLQYRGFTASPLLGLAQGIAVYQNGVRINEPLGDTVNWDLLPQSAIDSIALTGGATPLFGLNSLGGSMAVKMKDGFGHEGFGADLSAGSFGRRRGGLEFGGNNGSFGYYLNLEDFREDGWRDHSESNALNVFGSFGWRGDRGQVNLNYQHGESDLIGNGASPVELLEISRAAIFTGPDITAHDMDMASVDFSYQLSENASFSGNAFFRRNLTHSFNGDGSEFSIEDLEEEALSGTGILSDEAINNLSDRRQETSGADFQWTINTNLFGYNSRIIVGSARFRGKSDFNSVVELARIDPYSRLTTGLGTGTFVDEEATRISTETESTSIYFTTTTDLRDTVALTVSARANDTGVNLRDRSGERPELNGSHSYSRVNPAIGITWQASARHNLYASLGQSNRAPTPIELACNEHVYDLALAYAIADGDEAEDVEFECRLPNAFLADPPLEDVVAHNLEFGARGILNESTRYGLGVFRTDNRNDILFQTTGRATGLFANVDRTRRSGIEGSLSGELGSLDWFTAYSYVSATFEDDFQALSPNHDFADDEGKITVHAGDRIPGIPAHQFKFGAEYAVDERLILSFDTIANSGQRLRGDESNQLDEIDGYTLVNLGARYRVNGKLLVYAEVHNLFNSEFETFGLLGEEPSEVEVPLIEDFEIPFFLGAAPPRAGFLGLRYRF